MIRHRLSPLSGHWLDRVLAAMCLTLAMAVLVAASGYPGSAADFPKIIGILLALCGVGLWLFPGKQSDLSGVRLVGVGWAIVGGIAVLLAFAYVGADLALCFLFIGCALLMGHAPGLRLVVIAVLYTLVLGLVFGALLGVPLPGVLFALVVK